MTDVILINPSYSNLIYKHSKIKVGVPINPMLNLALLAAAAGGGRSRVRILDLNVIEDSDNYLRNVLLEERPRFAGITFTTPLFIEAHRLAGFIKSTSSTTKVIAGGPHATVFGQDLIKNSFFDIVAVGEADFVIKELLELPLDKVKGIIFKDGERIICSPPRQHIKNLDGLPLPAWNLYDLHKYNRFSLSNIASPPGYLETSRGCPWGCVFCNKNIQGRAFRPKSAKRVVDEIEYMLREGFREIDFLDDAFATDLTRAKLICEEIIKRKLKFPWHPLNGMRVDRLDKELFFLMKRSGCYKVSFGIESGNQRVLDRINKGIKLQQVYDAVRLAREAGLETFGYFMLGLPGDTEETMTDTINLAKRLKLDTAKFNITIPLPGTKLFEDWQQNGYIKTSDWAKYNFYSPHEEIYDHPTLAHDTLKKYYRQAYISFYFSLPFLWRSFVEGMKRGVLFRNIKLFFQTNWFN